VNGTAIAIAGAAIALGAAVEVHTNVQQVVTKAAGIIVGRALSAASAAGDQIEVLVIPQ
jgi:cell division protein FtsX